MLKKLQTFDFIIFFTKNYLKYISNHKKTLKFVMKTSKSTANLTLDLESD